MPDAWLAVDIGGTKAAAALYHVADDRLGPRRRLWLRREDGVLDSDHVVDGLMAWLADTAQNVVIRAVGVSIAAALAPDARRILYAPNLPGWEGTRLVDRLADALHVPVRLIQDGHATTVGEWERGALVGVREGALVAIGTGIGGGIIAQGHLVVGRDGLAGVAGYIPVLSEGRMLPLEQAVAGPALARRAGARGLVADAAALWDAADGGHPAALALVGEVLEELGQALAALVSLLNPERVVLAGSVGLAIARRIPALEAVILRHAQPTAATAEVRAAQLGADAALWGAVAAARRALPDPTGTQAQK